MTNLDSILKSRDITLPTKVRLVKTMVFPVVVYGCDNWTVKKAEHQRIDALELCCWRRLLRVPWTARRSNQSILKEISPGISLEGMMLKLNLQYFGHLMQRADSLEKTDAGRDWGQEEKRTTEDEMAGWHHWLDGHAAARSLQWCPTLCDLIDGSPPGSLVPGILQARTMEWAAISFSSAWKWKLKVKSFSLVWLLGTPWTAANQAPLSMGFSRQEYWSGVPLPSPQWTPVWVNSRIWWWTGRHGLLWFMGSQRVRHDWATELNWTELPRRALRGGSTQAPALSEKQLGPLSPSRPWLYSGYFQPLDIRTSWFSSLPLLECLYTLHNPMLVWDIWEWRVRKAASLLSLFSKYVLLSLCMVSVVTLWGEDEWNGPKDGRGRDDSRVIMTTRQAAQGLLLHASHSSRAHHKGCFVSITLPEQSITLPGQHLGELNLSGQGSARRRTCRRTTCPFTLTFTHTASHHAYSDATTNIYTTTIKTLILCHPTCKSSPGGYVQLVYTLSRHICEHR